MAKTEPVPTVNPQEPISANTLNVTKVAGLPAVVTSVAAAIGAALGEFKDERTAVVIAVLAVIAVAVVVAGFITVTDMRVRAQQTLAGRYLGYLRGHAQAQTATQHNGHEAHLMAPGVPTRVKLIDREDDPIWNLLAVKVDMEDDREITSFLAGNGQEQPGWFSQDQIRVLEQS
jgi:hypothetical protein